MRAVKDTDAPNFYVYLYLRTVPSQHGNVRSPYYVGKGRGKRAYTNGGRGIQRPRERTHIVLAGKELSENEAFSLEKRLIKQYGRIDLGTGCLRNKSDGGEGASGCIRTKDWQAKIVAARAGFRHTAKSKAMMSASRTGSKRSAETKARMSASFKGRKLGPMSEQQKAIRSAALKGRPKSEQFKAKIAEANRRRKLSEETRNKIAASLTGKKRSEESRARQSASNKGRIPANKGCKHSEETRLKMSAAQKARWERGDYEHRKKGHTAAQRVTGTTQNNQHEESSHAVIEGSGCGGSSDRHPDPSRIGNLRSFGDPAAALPERSASDAAGKPQEHFREGRVPLPILWIAESKRK